MQNLIDMISLCVELVDSEYDIIGNIKIIPSGTTYRWYNMHDGNINPLTVDDGLYS